MPGIQLPQKNLTDMNADERKSQVKLLLQEQVVEARLRLQRWKLLTNQSAQIDTGYVAQHLVSLVTGIKGSGMRGKGDDIEDKSEIKSANFLDSKDKKGATAPRWNFTSNDLVSMHAYLEVPYIYLVSLDWNTSNRFRARIWRLNPHTHSVFRSRYLEWIDKKGKPKLAAPNRPAANFQLFPPRYKTEEEYARHGNGREDGFEPVRIELNCSPTSSTILKAEENELQQIDVSVFQP